MGGQFQVDSDGSLKNLDSGTKVQPGEAAQYLEGFHANSEKQAEGAAKQKAAEGVKKGISTDYKDYGKGDALVTHDGEDWIVDHSVGVGVYARKEPGDTPTLLKWNEIAKHHPTDTTPKKEGPGSRGSTKWYYDKWGHVQYGEPPEGTKAGVGEPGGHGLKEGDQVSIQGTKHTVADVDHTGVILQDEEGHKTDVSPKDAADYMKTGHWQKQEPQKQEPGRGYHGAKVGDTVTVNLGTKSGGKQDAKVTKVSKDGGIQVQLPNGIPGNSAYGPGSLTHPEPDEITHVNGKPVGEAKPEAKTPAKIAVKKKAKGWATGTMEAKNQQGETTETHKGILHESWLFVHHKPGGGETEWSKAEHAYVKAPWKVSHAASGLSVGSQYKTKADAMAAAEKLAPIADWHKDQGHAP